MVTGRSGLARPRSGDAQESGRVQKGAAGNRKRRNAPSEVSTVAANCSPRHRPEEAGSSHAPPRAARTPLLPWPASPERWRSAPRRDAVRDRAPGPAAGRRPRLRRAVGAPTGRLGRRPPGRPPAPARHALPSVPARPGRSTPQCAAHPVVQPDRQLEIVQSGRLRGPCRSSRHGWAGGGIAGGFAVGAHPFPGSLRDEVGAHPAAR